MYAGSLTLAGCLPDFVTVPSAEDVIAEGQGPAGLSLSSDPTPWQANLQWSDRSQIETSFHIQRRELDRDGDPQGEFADVGTAVVNQVWWADQNVVTDTTYEYRVEAFQGVVSLGASGTIQAQIPTYQPVTTIVFEGPMTYETAVFSHPAFGYASIIYDQREAGLIGYYLDSNGLHGPFALDDGLGRYDRVERTLRLWWDGDSLFRVAQIRRNSGALDTVFTGWQRTGSRLDLTRMWGATLNHTEDDVYGSSVFGDRRIVFRAGNQMLCPIVLTDGIAPSTNLNHLCLSSEQAEAIDAPRSMLAFEDGTRLYLSTDNGSYVINVETPGSMQIVDSSPGAAPISRFSGVAERVWGRTTSGQFIAFENASDYNSGGGPELATDMDLSEAEFQYTATDSGGRQFTLSCSQGAEVFWQERLLQAIPLEHCAVDALLLNSTTLWLLADDGKLVTYDLAPRFGSWPEDRRR